MSRDKWIAYALCSLSLVPILFNSIWLRLIGFTFAMSYLYCIVKNIEIIMANKLINKKLNNISDIINVGEKE